MASQLPVPAPFPNDWSTIGPSEADSPLPVDAKRMLSPAVTGQSEEKGTVTFSLMPPALLERLYFNAEPSGSLRVRLANNDVYVAPQSRQEAQKPFHGVLSEAAPQQARHIGLRQPKQLCCVDLLETALSNDLVDLRDQLGLEQMRVGIRESQVSEYVWGLYT